MEYKIRNVDVEIKSISASEFVITKLGFTESGGLYITDNAQEQKCKTAKAVKIDGVAFKKFPHGLYSIFPNVQDLTISNCGIKQISCVDFMNFKNLKSLNLEGNKIIEVPIDAFIDLKNLTSLSLADNLVMFIDIKMFTDMDNLECFAINNDIYLNLKVNSNRLEMMKTVAKQYKSVTNFSRLEECLKDLQQELRCLDRP
jgi:Leucine-rich repeat (LRR) protein